MDKIINHIGISGGKDSDALLLWAIHESGYPLETIRATFCDTGNEAWQTYAHVKMLEARVHPVEWLKPALGFYDLAKKKQRFPSPRARFCTVELKIVPSNKRIKKWQEEGYTVINHTGIRAAESVTRRDMKSVVLAGEDGETYEVRRPLLRWSLDDVYAIHKRHDIPLNPLYALGCKRVGCLPCIMSRKSEILNIALKMPERFDMIREIEPQVAPLRGISTFFARDKVPLRYRTKIISAPIKPNSKLRVDEIVDLLETLFSDEELEDTANPTGPMETLHAPMAVCTIDDVVRWAMSGRYETASLEYDDLEEAPSCASLSGLCE
jgi:3'-phosphoadenosine 5'-phosphosulfate sulfotransferase (PAPS reductase)/FAD synthetase